MAGDWRRLALAALAAAAVVLSGVLGVHAQSASKTGKSATAAKKAPAKAADDDEEEELKPKAAAKSKKQDPAEAQRAVEAAGKMLEAGKVDQAAQSMTAVLIGGNLPPATMAKAFMYRGMAHRQQQKPAQAISDLTNALWLKGGLSPADRTSAQQQRSTAYADAGLTESGQSLVAAIPQTNTVAKERAASSTAGNWGAATTTTASNTSTSETAATTDTGGAGSGSGWSLFGGLFGGGSSAQTSTSSQTQSQQTVQNFTTTTTATATSAKAVPEPKASSWTSGTEVHGDRSSQEIETSSLRAQPQGRFRVQLAMVRSQDEAESVAAKVKRDYAAVLAARETEIDQAVVGNMGSFYRVRVGPFASQNEGQAACAKLRGSGLDCQVVTPLATPSG